MAAREGDEQKLGYELSPDFLKQYRSSPGAQQQVQPEADAAVDSRVEGPRTPENVAEPSRGTALSSSSPDPPSNARVSAIALLSISYGWQHQMLHRCTLVLELWPSGASYRYSGPRF